MHARNKTCIYLYNCLSSDIYVHLISMDRLTINQLMLGE